MHESALVGDLVGKAEAVAGDPTTITCLRLRIGALSGIDPGSLRAAVERRAEQRWGRSPAIEVVTDADPLQPGAGGVVLVSITARET